MKCPKCNQEPMSLIRIIFKFNRLTVICKNCEAKLRAGRLIRRMFYGAWIFGLGLVLIARLLDFAFDIALLVIVVVAIPAEFVAWNRGRYEEQETFEGA